MIEYESSRAQKLELTEEFSYQIKDRMDLCIIIERF